MTMVGLARLLRDGDRTEFVAQWNPSTWTAVSRDEG